MKRMIWLPLAAGLLLSAALLQGCGGGSDDAKPTSTEVQGQVLNAADGQPVAGATVVVAGGTSVQSNAEGRFSIALQGDGAVKAEREGFSTGIFRASAADAASTGLRVWLQPVASSQTISSDAGGLITVSGTPAQVSLPPAALSDTTTGQAFTGNAEIRVTPINPAMRPEAMPGSYQARSADGSTTTLESFGALHVELRDPVTGHALNLAAGKTATIRIPLATRSPAPPATLPLYHLDEQTGVWIEEGSATLVGSGAGAYYEGTVSHFSYWNADKPAETVYLSGCVRLENGSLPRALEVTTAGQDYAGIGRAVSNSDGTFRVPLRRDGRAQIAARHDNLGGNPLLVGPYNADAQLQTCLVVRDLTDQAPIIVEQPSSASLSVGNVHVFAVNAAGLGLRYQWKRNGVEVPNGSAETLLWTAAPEDDGAVFTVIVSNDKGSVTSQPLSINYLASGSGGTSGGQDEALIRLMYVGLQGWDLSMAPYELLGEEPGTFLPPSSLCTSGSVQASLDGSSLTGSEVAAPNVLHTLDVRFAGCNIDGVADYDGHVVAQASFSNNAGQVRFQGTSTMTDLQSNALQLKGNGVFTYDNTFDAVASSTQGTATPQPGATLQSLASGLTARVGSGSMSWQESSSGTSTTVVMKANDLAFTVDSVAYLASGQLSTTYNAGGTPTGSGELRLTSGSTLVGRVFYDTGTLKIEANGTVKPFRGATLPPAVTR